MYDGGMNVVVEFPLNGYAVHAYVCGTGTEQVIIYNDDTAAKYASGPIALREGLSGAQLPQPKRLSNSTLYPGGELPF